MLENLCQYLGMKRLKTILQCQKIKAESFYIWNLKLIKGVGGERKLVH